MSNIIESDMKPLSSSSSTMSNKILLSINLFFLDIIIITRSQFILNSHVRKYH